MTRTLPDVARSAWAAYRRMEESKRRYFSLLAQRESSSRDGDGMAGEDGRHLEELLNAHHERVCAFREAMQALLSENPDAHRVLLEHITLANADLGAARDANQ